MKPRNYVTVNRECRHLRIPHSRSQAQHPRDGGAELTFVRQVGRVVRGPVLTCWEETH